MTLRTLLFALGCGVAVQAHAGLFDDDEARKAILDLRAKVEQLRTDLNDKLALKSDKTAALDLVNQIEQMRAEIAKLNGKIEVLGNDIAVLQQRQKDFYVDLDNRIRKLEPQKIKVDGKDAQVDPAEQKGYDAAMAIFKSGDYKNAANAFAEFLRRYPDSAYAPAAQYSWGNMLYAQRDCKSAISVYKDLIKAYPDSPKAPDAMLNMAACHADLKEKPQSKKVLEALVGQYPDSEAARTAKERLGGK